MADRKMRTRQVLWMTGAMLLLYAASCYAQGATDGITQAEDIQSISFAQAFFVSQSVIGNLITWLLIAMSIAVTALTIHLALRNRESVLMPRDVVGHVEQLLNDRRYRQAIEQTGTDRSAFGQIMHAALAEAPNGYGAMTRAIEETGDLVGNRRTRPLEYLAVLGAAGPMLGLFGTVYGMIVAFQVIEAAGGNATPTELAGGIRTALVTTFWGLIVGIPAVAAYALIRNNMDTWITESMVKAEEIIGRFKPTRMKRAEPTRTQNQAAASQDATQDSTTN